MSAITRPNRGVSPLNFFILSTCCAKFTLLSQFAQNLHISIYSPPPPPNYIKDKIILYLDIWDMALIVFLKHELSCFN